MLNVPKFHPFNLRVFSWRHMSLVETRSILASLYHILTTQNHIITANPQHSNIRIANDAHQHPAKRRYKAYDAKVSLPCLAHLLAGGDDLDHTQHIREFSRGRQEEARCIAILTWAESSCLRC